MRADIAALQSRLGVTTVYVTHDQSEAMTLGHRVAVLKDARLQQCDTPRALYARPVNTFVAGFIGSPSMNLCTVALTSGSVSFGGVDVPVPAGAAGDRIVLGLRPEALELASEGLDAEVEVVEELGADAYVFCVADVDGAPAKLVARGDARRAPDRGSRVRLRPLAEEAHLFRADTGERIGACPSS
jgi:multiple sugar transport system ATP-binding protein